MKASIEIVEEEHRTQTMFVVYTYLILLPAERELLETERDVKLGEVTVYPHTSFLSLQEKWPIIVGYLIDSERAFPTKTMHYARAIKHALEQMIEQLEKILKEQQRALRNT